jgi:hypothetical protein
VEGLVKKKQNYNITLDYKITQSHARTISPSNLGKWDNIDFAWAFGVTGLVLKQMQKDPEVRKEVKDRMLARFDELIDSVTIT